MAWRTDAVAIGVGALLAKQLPERAIKDGAAALFAVFGLLLVLDSATMQPPRAVASAANRVSRGPVLVNPVRGCHERDELRP